MCNPFAKAMIRIFFVWDPRQHQNDHVTNSITSQSSQNMNRKNTSSSNGQAMCAWGKRSPTMKALEDNHYTFTHKSNIPLVTHLRTLQQRCYVFQTLNHVLDIIKSIGCCRCPLPPRTIVACTAGIAWNPSRSRDN